MQSGGRFENEIDLSNSIGIWIGKQERQIGIGEAKGLAKAAATFVRKTGSSFEAAIDYFDLPENKRQAVADCCKQCLDQQVSGK